MNIFISITILAFSVSMLPGCGNVEDERRQSQLNRPYEHLSDEERDYIERFNVVAKDIRDFPRPEKDIEKYFHVFKSVANLDDAKILLFAEIHTHSANQIWTAGVINRMVRPGDSVLFEGNEITARAGSVAQHLVTDVFAAREFEKQKSHKPYKPDSIDKLRHKFWSLFLNTKHFLALDVLNLDRAGGFYWDKVVPDNVSWITSLRIRNASMVSAIENRTRSGHRAFVIAGARHTPHYEFARDILTLKTKPGDLRNFLAMPGASLTEINDAYYRYFQITGKGGTTQPIFDYIKDRDFAVLIPKNLPTIEYLKAYLPRNAR